MPFVRQCGKYCIARQAIVENMAHAHCMLDKYGYKHTLIICNTYCFPLQQWLQERIAMLLYSTLPVFYVIYTTDFPLGGPGSPVIRTSPPPA